jgi:fatty-acyl-CoA synthase
MTSTARMREPGSDGTERAGGEPAGTDWFARWALYAPDRVALEDAESGRTYTYAECREATDRAARFLSDEFDIREGDRVAVLAATEMEYVFLLFAAQKLGAILVPLNFRLSPREISYLLGDSTPRLLLHQRRFAEIVTAIDDGVRPPRQLFFDGEDSYLSRLEDTRLPSHAVPVRAGADTPCMILYTSGTSGAPKGAIITPGMIFWNSVNTTLRLDLDHHDVTVTYAPLFHTGGWNVLTTPFLHRGAKVVFLGKFEPDLFLRLCERHRVTILFGLPTIMEMLRRSPEFGRVDLSSARFAIVGGEPMPLELIRAWQDRGIAIRQGYGLTEFGPGVFSLQEEHAERKIGSIGFPNFYVEARVVDDSDEDVPPGGVGELILRGPVCTPGYWNRPEASAEALRGGWFHTGDLVREDEEGFFYVVDRKKDMYKTGGENVYPAEVEHYLRTHPDVLEVAVIGVSDPRWGEAGKAYVVLREGADLTSEQIVDFCAGRLARFKTPREIAFVESLPRGDSGKILKRALKERA